MPCFLEQRLQRPPRPPRGRAATARPRRRSRTSTGRSQGRASHPDPGRSFETQRPAEFGRSPGAAPSQRARNPAGERGLRRDQPDRIAIAPDQRAVRLDLHPARPRARRRAAAASRRAGPPRAREARLGDRPAQKVSRPRRGQAGERGRAQPAVAHRLPRIERRERAGELVRLGEVGGAPREVGRGGGVQPREERHHPTAHEVARVALVGVALVLDPLQAAVARVLLDLRARDAEQRPQQSRRRRPAARPPCPRGPRRRRRARAAAAPSRPGRRGAARAPRNRCARARTRVAGRARRALHAEPAIRREIDLRTRHCTPYARAAARAKRAQAPAFGLIR